MNFRHVAVTGMGVETCLGNTITDFWAALRSGRSGIRSVTRFDPGDFPCSFAGEVDYHPEDYLSPTEIRRSSRYQQMAVTSALRAGADKLRVPRDRTAVIVGTGGGGFPLVEPFVKALNSKGWRSVDRFALLKTLPNMAAGMIAQMLGVTGPVLTVSTACAASTDALGLGYRLIRSGEVEAAVVVGVDVAITAVVFAGFSQLRAFASNWDHPEAASRPFDERRNGMVPAEGAAAFILQAVESNFTLLDRPDVEIIGAGSTCDAFNFVAPRPDATTAAAAVKKALTDARVTPQEVDLVSAHGTSTKLNDTAETLALKKALGARAREIPVSAVKSMTGHALGASGIIESVAAVLSIKHNCVTPTINLEYHDPTCDLDYVPACSRSQKVDTVLKVSFGFGGQNSALVLRRSENGVV